MGEKYKAPVMDWASPGDLKRRFDLFKQKCNLIFDGPLAEKEEAYKVRMLLLWIDDRGLEIYNAADWPSAAARMQLRHVWGVLEAYVKPRSNQVLASYQLRCLKQEDLSFDEYFTKARLLLNECNYPNDAQDRILRDTLVFGVKSEKVRRDAIDEGEDLTLQKVVQLAKTHESTEAQLTAMKPEQTNAATHAVRSKQQKKQYKSKKPAESKPQPLNDGQKSTKMCVYCDGNHSKRDTCPARGVICNFCKKKGHYAKACLKKKKQAHEVNTEDFSFTLSDVGSITTKHINNVSTVASPTNLNTTNKIYAMVKLNDSTPLRLKVDTGSDTCIITREDLERARLKVDIRPSNCVLTNYGGGRIPHTGTARLKISFRGKSITADFKVVKVIGSPSVLGCSQSIDLGIISLNVHSVNNSAPCLTKEKVLSDYSDCFDKIGRFPGEKYNIKLIEDAKPVVHAPRTVPVHIMPLYKTELEKMLADGIISPVSEPTDWVNSIVCSLSEKEDGTLKVRLCLDPRDLNKNIRREHYYTRTIDEILPFLHGKKYYSVVDTKKGYWHVELDEESSLLCTFNTPFGRYKFNRLPFGVRVSQDVFQKKLDQAYEGIPNLTGIADDILIAGSTPEEHDTALKAMLEASRKNNIGLNSEKFQFKSSTVNFYGHTITDKGLQPATQKLEAIKNLKSPTSAKELTSALGMITYLNRFSAKIAELSAPLRELTKKEVYFHWDKRHEDALQAIKKELLSVKVLSYYDPNPCTKTTLQCDASEVGIGAWIRQTDKQGQENVVAMASRATSDAESRYSNLERECLGVMYGLQKFEYYLMGRHTLVETDHSPLEQIFKKNVADSPPRLQRMILECLKYDINVVYKPGESIPVADALSRVCFNPDSAPKEVHEVSFISLINAPINIMRIKEESARDSTHRLLKDIIFRGWPEKRSSIPDQLFDYWNFRSDLVLDDGLILKGNRILIPTQLRKEVLKVIHTAHQGEVKSLLLAKESVFWPGLSKDIREMVQQCPACAQNQSAPAKMPIQQPDLPTRPWEKIGTDIFEYQGKRYLMIVDYYSRYMIVKFLPDIRAETVSNTFIEVLTEFGLPSTIMADCGTQYTSELFKQKCKDSSIELVYSSPYHHQSNSVAERSIGIAKSLWKKAGEEGQSKSTALWMHRITPVDSNTPSPYELLFGRKPRSLLPCSAKSIAPKHPDADKHQDANLQRQETQARNYNKNTSRDLRTLQPGEPVDVYNTITRVWEPATVVRRERDRSYVISRNSREYFRTREHIKPRHYNVMNEALPIRQTAQLQPTNQPVMPVRHPSPPRVQQPARPTEQSVQHQDPQIQTGTDRPVTTRSGRTVKRPDRYTN